MSKSLHVVGMYVWLGAALLGAASPAGAQSAVVFQGLRHAPIGSALLRVDTSRDALEVSNLGSAGADGVAVDLGGEAKIWTARMNVAALRSIPSDTTFEAIAEGQRISTESVHQVGSRFALTPTFTGATRPTFSAQVYNNGNFVAGTGSLPSGGAHVFIPISFCDAFPELFHCGFTTDFYNDLDTSCVWKHTFAQAVDIALPNGVVAKGNELRLVEEVQPAGRNPYLGFDVMTIRSNARVLTLLKETVR